MILRRFMQHVKDQNWFAVGLDVIVVIVGIFLGLQVQQWNTERSAIAEEKIYLNRFHTEVSAAIEIGEAELIPRRQGYSTLLDVIKILNGEIEADDLTQLQCHTIFLTVVFSDQLIALPTMVELMASGQLSIIQNSNFKAALAIYSISQGRWQESKDDIRSDSFSISRKYPEMMKLDLRMTSLPSNLEETNSLNHFCDLALMKISDSFQNDLLDLTTKHSATIEFFLQDQVNQLKNLHQQLDNELDIVHAGSSL